MKGRVKGWLKGGLKALAAAAVVAGAGYGVWRGRESLMALKKQEKVEAPVTRVRRG
jgi:hypothetical protein